MFGDLGLAAALSGEQRPSACAKTSPLANLSLLALTLDDEVAYQALTRDGSRVYELLRSLEGDFGFIVVDLPPTDSGLCFSTAGTLNGVLLVMEAQRTHSAEAARAKQRLIHANAAVLGVILNKQAQELPGWLDARL